MAESLTPLADRQAELEGALDAALARRSEAKDKRRHEAGALSKQATAALVKFRDDILMRKPDAVPVEEREAKARELTSQLLDFMGEHGLIFEALGPRGGTVSITDPSVGVEVREADADVLAARRGLADFKDENREALDAEGRAAEAARIRAALEGDDPEAIREAITGPRTAALTTDDFGGSRAGVHRVTEPV